MPVEQGADDLRTAGITRGTAVPIWVDGEEVEAFEGETVLAVLWAKGRHTLHTTARTHEPRGFFCGIGVCFDCLVTIDGIVNLRACLEPVRPGMKVTLQRDAGYVHAD
jgi:predicted molibdopterin-dependent oxidoreductase YjgC